MTTTSISRRRVLALATGAASILAAPAVRAQAKVAINAGGLDRLLEIFAA